jgi:hypothetical protein
LPGILVGSQGQRELEAKEPRDLGGVRSDGPGQPGAQILDAAGRISLSQAGPAAGRLQEPEVPGGILCPVR